MPGQSWSGTVTDGSSWVWPEPVCVGSVQVDPQVRTWVHCAFW